MTYARTPIILALGLLLAGGARAGSLTAPAAPNDAGSAMYRIGDIYDRLDTGAPGALRTGPFAEPTAGPSSTGHTLNEVMGMAPALDAAGAAPADVASGKTFWGLKGGAWGTQTGTMPNVGAQTITPGAAAQAISLGYHDGTGSVAGDLDLAAGNIVSGVQIFGVTGTASLASGNAAASEVLTGRTFSNAGGAATGSMPNIGVQNIAPGAAAQAISAGYHNGAGTVAGDADLVPGNIRQGVDLFGITGSVLQATGAATAAQVLTGVGFSNAAGAGTGTMPNIGVQTITPGTAAQTISAGYHNGSGMVAGDADLAAGNLKQGVDLFGVVGTYPLAGVARTGQATSYSATGGEDGDLQKGVAWPSPRFTDNGNGSVTDNLSGLIWLKNANCFSIRTWEQALANANALANGQCSLTDGSTAGQWRLPNVKELQSLINFGTYNPALPSGHPFSGVQSNYYWSSTTDAYNTSGAWLVYLYYGYVNAYYKTNSYYVWPVRGGQ